MPQLGTVVEESQFPVNINTQFISGLSLNINTLEGCGTRLKTCDGVVDQTSRISFLAEPKFVIYRQLWCLREAGKLPELHELNITFYRPLSNNYDLIKDYIFGNSNTV